MRFVAAGTVLLVALVACSDTPVSPPAFRAQAAYFDSLATLQIENDPTGDNTRVMSLEVIANAFSHGAQPGVVTMTIAGTPVTVHVVGVQLADLNDLAYGPFFAAAWITSDADTTIFVNLNESATGFIDQSVALAVGDSSEWTQSYPPQFTFSQRTTSASCTNYLIRNQLAGPDPECHLALATVSFNAVPATFQASPQLLPVGAAIVSPTVTFGVAQLAMTGGF